MRRIVRGRPSPALVVSIVALFVALGGTGYAAFGLPKDSVGSRQLKAGAVTPSKVANSTIRLFKGQKGVTGVRGLKGDAGVQGLKGDTGAQGVQGPAGTNAATHAVVRTATASVPDNDTGLTLAHCNPGEVAVGGGGSFANTDPSAKEAIQRTGPLAGSLIATAGATADGWFVRGYNTSGAPNDLTAYAICVSP
jgi:hypothetical protein